MSESVDRGLIDLALLAFLRRGGPLTARAISEDLLMEQPQAANLIQRMVRRGLLRETGTGVRLSKRGRHPAQFALTHEGVDRLCGIPTPDWAGRVKQLRGAA